VSSTAELYALAAALPCTKIHCAKLCSPISVTKLQSHGHLHHRRRSRVCGVASARNHDFAGPYNVNRPASLRDPPATSLQLDPTAPAVNELPCIRRDTVISGRPPEASTNEYETRMYSFLADNCHSFVGSIRCKAGIEHRAPGAGTCSLWYALLQRCYRCW
jgi:hypothetical protein